MKKKLLVLISMILLNSCYTTMWKFEVEPEKYPDEFPKQSNSKTISEMRFHNNYFDDHHSKSSVHFPNKDSETWINIEHLVKLIPYDLQKLNDYENTNYLFTSIEFHKDLDIKEVEIKHFIGNKELQLMGSYIYKLNRDEKGKLDYTKGYSVSKVESKKIFEDDQFSYVNIYKMPISNFLTKILPKRLWFISSGKEQIKIKYLEDYILKEKVLEYEIKWMKRIYWIT